MYNIEFGGYFICDFIREFIRVIMSVQHTRKYIRGARETHDKPMNNKKCEIKIREQSKRTTN